MTFLAFQHDETWEMPLFARTTEQIFLCFLFPFVYFLKENLLALLTMTKTDGMFPR